MSWDLFEGVSAQPMRMVAQRGRRVLGHASIEFARQFRLNRQRLIAMG